MTVIKEVIASTFKGPYKVQFGRIIAGELDRFYFVVNNELAVVRPSDLRLFLDRINAYMSAKDTLIGDNLKSGISTGNANATQIGDYQPPKQPPVKSADFTRGRAQ